MRITRIVGGLGLLFLSGCAGVDSAMQYDGINPVSFESGDSTWRIFDKPNEGRVMITPSIAEAAAEGAMTGLTFGGFDSEIPKPVYQAAVAAWLGSTDRHCTITDGYKLIRPQWEFTYQCGAVPAPQPTSDFHPYAPAATAQ